jgi:hypothetical protein
MDENKNATAAMAVYLLSIASIVLPLLFPKKDSAPPAMEPDKPADFPDCSNTIITIPNAIIICKILRIIAPTLKPKTSLK